MGQDEEALEQEDSKEEHEEEDEEALDQEDWLVLGDADVETTKQEDGAPDQVQDKDSQGNDLKRTAQQLEEMGLGNAETLLELLKSNEGNVQRTLETLLMAQ